MVKDGLIDALPTAIAHDKWMGDAKLFVPRVVEGRVVKCAEMPLGDRMRTCLAHLALDAIIGRMNSVVGWSPI